MGMNLIPFGGVTEYPATSQCIPTPDVANVIYLTVQDEVALNAISEMFARWFAGREEVEIVDKGTSDKLGESFLVIEWFECEIDQLFLDILDAEDVVTDYTVYSREVD